ncbi:hypothetical protein W02_23250 [Nitrospira sp. KM1]|nr:hypothetical protein W02_23250 [Nitrospira sp. KM1]
MLPDAHKGRQAVSGPHVFSAPPKSNARRGRLFIGGAALRRPKKKGGLPSDDVNGELGNR